MANSYSSPDFTINTNCNWSDLAGYKGSAIDANDNINLSSNAILSLDTPGQIYAKLITGAGTLAYNQAGVILNANITATANTILTLAANSISIVGNLTGSASAGAQACAITGGTLTVTGQIQGGGVAAAHGILCTTGSVDISNCTITGGITATAVQGVSIASGMTNVTLTGVVCTGGISGTNNHGILYAKTTIWTGLVASATGGAGITCHGLSCSALTGNIGVTNGCTLCKGGSGTTCHGLNLVTVGYAGSVQLAKCVGGSAINCHGFTNPATSVTATYIFDLLVGGIVEGAFGAKINSGTSLTVTAVDCSNTGSPIMWGVATTISFASSGRISLKTASDYVSLSSNSSIGPYHIDDVNVGPLIKPFGPYPII